MLRETPPPGATVLSVGWTRQSDGSYTLQIGDLAAGAAATRPFVVQLPNPFDATTVINVVSVRDDGRAGPDPTPDNNRDDDTDQLQAGRVGDWVWHDADADGVPDASEVGMPGVPLQLLDPATGRVLATTTTDAQGRYAFTRLRFGRYAVRIVPAALQTDPLRAFRLTTPATPSGAISSAAPRNDTLDLGLVPRSTTAIVLAYLQATRLLDGDVQVRWGTLEERDTAAFQVWRSTTPDRAQATLVAVAPSQGSQGGDYQSMDMSAPAGPLFYWLIEVETDGTATPYGPVVVDGNRVYLPLLRR